jgi:outer membrane immunogenic protein
MRRLFIGLALVAVATPITTIASAADLKPVYKATPAPVATYSWTGFYVGGHAGYGWGKGDTSIGFIDSPVPFVGPAIAAGIVPTPFSPDPDGFIGGFQLGYNYQVANWVLGFETDISFAGIGGSQTINTAVPAALPLTSTVTQDLDWFGTIRGRLGWTGGNWLIYATGGAAYGHVKSSYLVDNTVGGGNILSTGSASDTKWGWTAGGGLEYGSPLPPARGEGAGLAPALFVWTRLVPKTHDRHHGRALAKQRRSYYVHAIRLPPRLRAAPDIRSIRMRRIAAA